MFRQIKSKRRVEHIGWIANDEKETSNYADMDTSQQGDKRRPGYRIQGDNYASYRHFINHITEDYELHVHKETSGHGDIDTSRHGLINKDRANNVPASILLFGLSEMLDTHTYFVGIRTQTFPQSKLARLLIQLTRMRRYARVN